MNLKRILMNEVDAGGGNGAAAPAPTQPADTQPQAQGAPVITKEIADVIASTVSKAVADVKDSIFAEARRTFTGKKDAKTKTEDVAPPPQTSAPDPIRLRSLDRELNKHGIATRLSDTQYQRVEKIFAMESPEDVSGWVKDYFDGWGNAASAPASAPVSQPVTQAQPQPRTAVPVSDRGSPPVSAVPLEEQKVLAMSPSDREALRRQKGDKWFTDRVLEESRGQQFKLR